MLERVVPEAAIPGSPKRIDAAITNARDYAQYVEQDARPLVRSCRELREVRAWEKWLADEPKTWERFCTEALGYDAAFLAEIEIGIDILEGRGHQGRIGARAAVEAANAEGSLPEQAIGKGEAGPGRGHKTGDIITRLSRERGTDSTYLARRLKRDDPDAFAKLEAGEYRSVRAAALDAGIVKPRLSIPLDPARAARILARHFDVAELIRQLALVGADVDAP